MACAGSCHTQRDVSAAAGAHFHRGRAYNDARLHKEGQRLYRYNVSTDAIRGRRAVGTAVPLHLPADVVETAVVREIRRLVRAPEIVTQAFHEPHWLRAIARAWNWRRMLEARSRRPLPSESRADSSTSMLRLAYLSPAVLQKLLLHRRSSAVSIDDLAAATELSWAEQEITVFGEQDNSELSEGTGHGAASPATRQDGGTLNATNGSSRVARSISGIEYTRWPEVHESHIQAVKDVAYSGEWHYGHKYLELERTISAQLGRPTVTTASCAWSIYLALRTLNIVGKVAVPAYGYPGTVHPIVWAACEPLFVDCNPYSFNICPERLREACTRLKLSAVVAVHIHGLPFDYEVVEICKEYGLPLIEDVCQAQGARLRGALTGTLGECGAFSFNTRKTLPAGLGGALSLLNESIARRAAELRDYGARDSDGTPNECGYYLPISEFDAALILVQLPNLDGWIKRGQRLASILRQAIPDRFPQVPSDRTHTWHKVRIRGSEAERMLLEDMGVITSRWVPRPLPEYPCYRQFVTPGQATYIGAAEICTHTFCLLDDQHSIHVQTDECIREISEKLRRILR